MQLPLWKLFTQIFVKADAQQMSRHRRPKSHRIPRWPYFVGSPLPVNRSSQYRSTGHEGSMEDVHLTALLLLLLL